MRTVKTAFALFGLLLVLNPSVFADSPPESTYQMTQLLNPNLEILAETVRVNVKNRAAVTKVLLVLRNPAATPLATGFSFPLTKEDTLIDFGITRLSEPGSSAKPDSSPPLASLADYAESSDSASADSQVPGFRLASGETASVLLVYQSAPDTSGNRFRYAFPLKEGFKTIGTIRSFAFFADIDENARIMEVKTEGYPIVVRGNGPKLRAYFWQNNLRPRADLGFSYRLEPKKPKEKL